ncbi:multicopper oxidase domain-containing protein, partial [Pyxidicoccus fallax]
MSTSETASLPPSYPHLLTRERLPDGVTLFTLEARPATLSVGDQETRVLTYNGTLPGPLLLLEEGERVRIVLRNALPDATNLHLHGLPIPPAVDDPHRVVAPGAETSYEFTVPEGSAGTYWYHPHLHGSVTRQLFEGLSGPLLVRGPLERSGPLAAAWEHVLVLSDLSIDNGRVADHTEMDWGRGKEGSLLLVNGQVRPTLTVRTGLVRLRLINASTARYHQLALPGRALHVIGQDGAFLEAPVAMESLLLVPGERADVLVTAEEAGTLQLLSLPYARTPAGPSPREPVALLTLQVEGA